MNSVVEPNIKKQRGRASPLLPLLGRRPHVVVLSGMNDTKCDLERKTRLVGRSRGIHVNKYKSQYVPPTNIVVVEYLGTYSITSPCIARTTFSGST